MRSAGLIIAIALCVLGIIGIVVRSPEQANSLAVFALACVAMVLSVAYVGTQLFSKATDATRDIAASTQKLVDSIRKIENPFKTEKD